MLADLRRVVEELDIPVAGDAIAEVLAVQSVLDARLAEAVAAYDRAELWDLDGSTSMVGWLRDSGGMTSRAATRLASTSKRVSKLAAVAKAWSDGTLSSGQVEAIVANLRPNTIDLFASHEAELVPVLAALSVTDTAKAMREWAARADAEGPEPAEPERSLHLSRTLDGRCVLDGDLDAEGGQVVATALNLAETADAPAEPPRTPSRRRADALYDICRTFLDFQRTHVGGRHRPHLNVIVHEDDLATGGGGRFADGTPADDATIRRLACDAALHRVVVGSRSAILDYGVATRTIPAPLWNALVIRDEHCRFPGCDRPPRWCEGHHVRWASNGGPTNLGNLVMLCARHHHRLHQPGWSATLRDDGLLTVTCPDGMTRKTGPPLLVPRRC